MCYQQPVKEKQYLIDTEFRQGVYLLRNNGIVYSHSVEADNKKNSTISFKSGSFVSVELNPLTGELTYSVQGSDEGLVQKTSIRSSTE